MIEPREKRDIRRQAFVDSLPVLMGYSTMGFVAGVLLGAKGGTVLYPLWGFLTSALWISGTLSFVSVPEFARHSPLAAFLLLTLLVNFRYAFYGFTLLKRWRTVKFPLKAYLILMLTDENYALEAAHEAPDDERHLYYCKALSLFNHSYWVGGVVLGTLVVLLLGHLIDPETIRRYTNGMEFTMAALFLVIFTDQMRTAARNAVRRHAKI